MRWMRACWPLRTIEHYGSPDMARCGNGRRCSEHRGAQSAERDSRSEKAANSKLTNLAVSSLNKEVVQRVQGWIRSGKATPRAKAVAARLHYRQDRPSPLTASRGEQHCRKSREADRSPFVDRPGHAAVELNTDLVIQRFGIRHVAVPSPAYGNDDRYGGDKPHDLYKLLHAAIQLRIAAFGESPASVKRAPGLYSRAWPARPSYAFRS